MERDLDVDPDRLRLRQLSTAELTRAETAAIRALMDAAFRTDDEEERFTDDDWQHAVGGVHFVLVLDGEIVAHAAVVEREIHVGGRALRTGYVEAVATAPERQGAGLGSIVMTDVSDHVRETLRARRSGHGSPVLLWAVGLADLGRTVIVRTADGDRPTPGEDGSIMVLETPSHAAARPLRPDQL